MVKQRHEPGPPMMLGNMREQGDRSRRSPDWIKVKNPNAPAATRILEW